MAFTTIQGSGATDATSFVGTAGVDSLLVLNPTTTTAASGGNYVEAQASADTITLNSFTTAVTGGTTVFGGQGADTINAAGNTIVSGLVNGNKDADVIGGATTSFNQVEVYGGQGADNIQALNLTGGFINGNKNADTITTAAAGTVSGAIYGGQGVDNITVNGALVGATVRGDNDTDVITISTGAGQSVSASVINGNKGADQITWNMTGAGNQTNSTVYGGAGNDTLNSLGTAAEEITLSGDLGNDTITLAANGQNDTVDGGAGTDTITTNTGTNRIIGGTGADVFTDNGTDADVYVQGGSDSNAATANTKVAGANTAAGNAITIDADFVTGFDQGTDDLDMGTTTIGDLNLVGSATTSAGINIVYGTYNTATNVFTVEANQGGNGDALVFTNAAGVDLTNAASAFGTNAIILNAVAAALDATNFV